MKRNALALIFLFGASQVSTAACVFKPWMEFKNTDMLRLPDSSAYMYVTAHSRIDADGAPNSYHPDDVGKNCLHDPHVGLDCPANAGFPNQPWWREVLVPSASDPAKPHVQPDGPTKGFFISGTWLADPDLPATDPKKFVDSVTIPYLVFPGKVFPGLSGTGSLGDVGIAWNLSSGRSTAFIVADKGGGGEARLGEGSIRLYEALGGVGVNPRTGAGVAPGNMRFLMFPGSRSRWETPWPHTEAEIAELAQSLFEGIGSEASFADCPEAP